MSELNKQIDFFLAYNVNTDPLHQNVEIYFSDSNVPGEGEHKIMSYIRWYQNLTSYSNSMTYCIYSNDSDLLILCLLSHEHNVVILRETRPNKPPKLGIMRQPIFLDNSYVLIYQPAQRIPET